MKKIVLPILFILLLLPGTSLAECIDGNCKNGEGIYVFSDGSRYKGMFRNGRIEGEGAIEYADKSKYAGSFIGGVPHGHGFMKYSSGATYKGNFDNGTISGTGTLNSADGSMYEGNFDDGLFHGKGTFTFPDDKKYKGDFKRGLFDGKGALTTKESVLVIKYEDGNCVGKGTISFFKDDTSIKGECKDGEFVYTKKIQLPKAKMAAETELEPKEVDREFEFEVYEPENFYKEPTADELFVPQDFSEAQQPLQDQFPVPEDNEPDKDTEEKM